MAQKFLEWYPAFTAVETREDGVTDKFVMIADMDKGIFEALQEHPNLTQLFCQNHGSKKFPLTKNDRTLYWESFSMAEKRQVDDLIPKLSMEMWEKVGKYGKETIFPAYCRNLSGTFTNNFAEQTNKCNNPMRCLGPYSALLRFLEDEERRFSIKKVLIWDRLFPAENFMSLHTLAVRKSQDKE